VKDAISVAKAVPVDYLWIDAVCILQDSPEDKAKEVARMAQIYHHSVLTIVAANSEDMTHGFLQMRPDPFSTWSEICARTCRTGRVLTLPFRFAQEKLGTVFLQCAYCGEKCYDPEPIQKRAWTLQEEAMAQRLLVYRSSTLEWSCNTLSHYLDAPLVPAGAPKIQTAKPPNDKIMALGQWQHIVWQVSRRELSLSSDMLPAVAALAQQYKQVLGPGYFAGIWEYGLLQQLCWIRIYLGKRNAVAVPQQYRAPTWSWVSSADEINHQSDISLGRPACEMVHVSTTPKHSSNPYGEVESGHLTLRGRLRDAFIIGERVAHVLQPLVWSDQVTSSAELADLYYFNHKDEEMLVGGELDSQRHEHEQVEQWKGTHSVKCFLLYEKFGLLLREVREEGRNEIRYRRVGFCSAPRVESFHDETRYPPIDYHFNNVPVVEITIV
jgi:hypothetical protein